MKLMASKLNTTRPLRERTDYRHELKVQVFLPDVECGGEEIVNAGNRSGLQEELGLRAAFFAGDQYLGNGRSLGVGKDAVHVAHEVAAQRDQEQHAQAAAG